MKNIILFTFLSFIVLSNSSCDNNSGFISTIGEDKNETKSDDNPLSTLISLLLRLKSDDVDIIKESKVKLVLTGSVHGQLDPCG